MSTVAIRNMDEKVWAEVKSRAARNKLSLAEYIESLVKKDSSETNWEKVLLGPKILSEKEAKAIEKASKEIRKNFKMREFDWD